MTDEAVIIELFGEPKGQVIRYAVPNTYSVEKGTLLKFSGAGVRTVAKTLAADCGYEGQVYFAGIAAEEKVSGDGATSIGVYTNGVFDLYYGANAGTCVPGSPLVLSGANRVSLLPDSVAFSGSKYFNIVGKALEGCAAATSDTISVEIGASS